MKSIWEFFFPSEKEELPFPDMISFSTERKDKSIPSEEDVNKQFSQLMKELDFDILKRRMFETMTYTDKWQFILRQEDHERRVPTPEYVIDALQSKYDIHLISSIALNLKTARLSWVERFCMGGGHILLLRELASATAYHQLFINSYPRNTADVDELLRAMKAVVDTRHGSQHMLLFFKSIEVIVTSINIFNPKQFETCLYILLPFVFMEEGPKQLIKAFKRLGERNNHRFAFRIFADQIAANPKEISNNIFFTFISGLYQGVAGQYEDRLLIDFEYLGAGIIEVLENLPEATKEGLSPRLENLINSIKADFNEISLLLQGEPALLSNGEELGKEAEKSKPAISILMQMISIMRNQPESAEEALDNVQTFMLKLRSLLVEGQNAGEAIKRSHYYAAENSALGSIQIPTTNLYYAYTNDRFGYVSDSDLKEVGFSESRPRVEVLEEELKEARKQLENSEAEELRKQIECLKEQLASASDAAVELSKAREELSSVHSQLEQAKAENEKLTAENGLISARFAEVAGLAAVVPATVDPLKFRKLDSAQIDVGAAKAKLSEAKAEAKENEAVLARLNELGGILDGLAEAQSRFVREVQDDRAMASTAFVSIQEVQNQIITALKIEVEQHPEPVFTPYEAKEKSGGLEKETRRLLWRPLPDNVLSKEWELEEVSASAEELVELFGADAAPEGRILGQFSAAAYAEAIDVAALSPEEIARAISLETFNLRPEALDLIRQLPDVESEAKRAVEFAGDASKLCNEDRLAFLLARIPGWRRKAAAMLEHHRFDTDITVMQQNLKKVGAALEQIRASKVLHFVLSAVLAAGRLMNGDAARGFSLDIAGELKGFKANDGSSFMNYIAAHLPEGDLSAETERVRAASLVDVTAIQAHLRAAQIMLANRPGEPFAVASSRRISEVLKEVARVQESYKGLARALGVSDALLKPQRLFSVIAQLASDLQRAAKENSLRSSQKEKTVAPKKAAVKDSAASLENKQRGILSSMVDILKTSEAPVRRTGLKRAALEPEPQGPTEYELVFSRVRKAVAKSE